jgi:hypothetical protein
MPINLGSIKNELLPGLRALTGKYDPRMGSDF